MRRLLDRTPTALVGAPLKTRNWRALAGFVRDVPPGGRALIRYLTQRGTYPWSLSVRTPTGIRQVILYSRHDLLTLNEVFCRRDYDPCPGRVFVDVGANIGLASLYFLTRAPSNRVICYEPNPLNVNRIRDTLEGFEDRYEFHEAAMSPKAGRTRFKVEGSGRYGGIAENGEIEVETISIEEELRAIAKREGTIDLVKIDTEGTERQLVDALPRDGTVRAVCWEDRGKVCREAMAPKHG